MKRQTIDTYEAAVSYLYDMPRFTAKNTLEDTRAQLERLGSPDRNIRHIIHVAGTNGKGSVCAYMRSVLEEAGYAVAMFTSPHLVDIRERFVIRGEMISRDEFLKAFLQVYDSLNWIELEKGEGYHPTFFEYLFLMAMLWFSQADADYCILETGLGGRLDATNAVADKRLTVITRISRDHVEYLGDTIALIAGEKAGIMRANTPLVYCGDVEEAAAVFEEYAHNLRIYTYPVSKKDYAFENFHNKTIDFSLHTRYYGYIRVSLHTLARYQMENATLAVRAIELLDEGRTITAGHLRRGLERCLWPGRMEEVLPEVYVDGAHNEDGIRAFLDTVRADGCEGRGQSRTLLFSVVRDKDYRSMIEQVSDSGLFTRIAVAHMGTGRAAELSQLAGLFDGKALRVNFYDSVSGAFRSLLDERGRDERVYIAGSLDLVGEIKEF
ncbi:MAG: bifunctional folylpolyglutamate synthase/dihydrofolate synthase, partial [Butyrivibrio sp.]|nr:bifunctional folylpolyglutamate synthase/dihydrofolate synthase [Butyrivibrio sp.]